LINSDDATRDALGGNSPLRLIVESLLDWTQGCEWL